MAIFCAAIRRDSISFLKFLFLSHVLVFLCLISLVCRLKYPYSCFSSHFCFLIIVVLLILMLSVVFLVGVICLSLLFLCSPRILKLMHPGLPVLMLLLFLTHIVYWSHLSDIRLWASLLSFLPSGLCVDVLPLFIWRMVSSILQAEQIIIIIIMEFFTSVLTDGFSLEFEWQLVSSSLQDSSQDSGRS